MAYDPSKQKPIQDLSALEILVRELRASGVSIRDMYKGMKSVLARQAPTYREITDALSASGADPRNVKKGGVFNSHQLYEMVPDFENADTFHPEWVNAKRVGTSPRYPGFREDRKREARFERTISPATGLPIMPPGTVDKLVRNQVAGHVFRTAKMSRKYEVLNDRLSEDLLRQFEEEHTEGSP
jgi:hypothetical protein